MSVTPEEREAKQRSAIIDREIRQAAKDYENTIKILLLGKSLISFVSSLLLGTSFEVLCAHTRVCVCTCNGLFYVSYKLKSTLNVNYTQCLLCSCYINRSSCY